MILKISLFVNCEADEVQATGVEKKGKLSLDDSSIIDRKRANERGGSNKNIFILMGRRPNYGKQYNEQS
jgi:hypothetical protein